jgi:hypothetical protein
VAVTGHPVVGRRGEVPIPGDQCQARLVGADPEAADSTALLLAAETAAERPARDREEATPEADRVAALQVTDAITTKRFLPRFTPLLTHRQEAPKGASCPPEHQGGKGERILQDGIQFPRSASLAVSRPYANKAYDLGVESMLSPSS